MIFYGQQTARARARPVGLLIITIIIFAVRHDVSTRRGLVNVNSICNACEHVTIGSYLFASD